MFGSSKCNLVPHNANPNLTFAFFAHSKSEFVSPINNVSSEVACNFYMATSNGSALGFVLVTMSAFTITSNK